ncbi:SRPBCC family protein [Spirillospora sp. NPDC047279]|uniref:SRPBCC family protein n=1 Tax=Spirillospora sp. NPDC047279 TaxID=3155478 RepID=UPI0033D9B791
MATVRKEIIMDAPPERVWGALRDFGAVDRLAPGFVTASRVEGDDRVITFFSGVEARERLVGIDEDARRVAYSVTESPMGLTHHMASAQVVDEDGRSRFVWITDCLPDAVAGVVADYMERGMEAMRAAMEESVPR